VGANTFRQKIQVRLEEIEKKRMIVPKERGESRKKRKKKKLNKDKHNQKKGG